MLLIGETPQEYKENILDNIRLNKDLIKLLPFDGYSETIAILRQEIKDDLQELIKLEKWRSKNKLGKLERYLDEG